MDDLNEIILDRITIFITRSTSRQHPTETKAILEFVERNLRQGKNIDIFHNNHIYYLSKETSEHKFLASENQSKVFVFKSENGGAVLTSAKAVSLMPQDSDRLCLPSRQGKHTLQSADYEMVFCRSLEETQQVRMVGFGPNQIHCFLMLLPWFKHYSLQTTSFCSDEIGLHIEPQHGTEQEFSPGQICSVYCLLNVKSRNFSDTCKILQELKKDQHSLLISKLTMNGVKMAIAHATEANDYILEEDEDDGYIIYTGFETEMMKSCLEFDPKMTSFELDSCNLSGETCLHFTTQLENCTLLEKFVLVGAFRFAVGLATSFSQMKHLTHIHMEKVSQRARDSHVILSALSNCRCLVELNLNGNKLTRCLEELFGVDGFPFLELLCLESCKLLGEDIQSLAQAAKSQKLLRVQILSLNCNDLEGHLVYLFRDGKSDWPNLKTLLLRDTKMSESDLNYLAQAVCLKKIPNPRIPVVDALIKKDLESLYMGLLYTDNLQILDLSNCCLEAATTKQIAQAAKDSALAKVQRVDLSNNNLCGQCEFLFVVNGCSNWLSLATLQLTNTKLCHKDFKQLGLALANGELFSLLELHINENRMTDCLALLLQDLRCPALEKLQLDNCDLSEKDIKCLAKVAKEAKLENLQHLHLARNKLTGCLITLFGQLGHPGWPRLKFLALDQTNLNDTDMAHLALARTNFTLPSLQRMDIPCPGRLEDHWKTLLSQTKTEHLDFSHVSFLTDTDKISSLSEAFLQNQLPYLKELTLIDTQIGSLLKQLLGNVYHTGFACLSSLCLQEANLQLEDIRALGQAVKEQKLPCLRKLNISHNELSGCLVLLETDETCEWPRLEDLNLAATNLGVDDIHSLGRTAKQGKFSHLKTLNLEQNNITSHVKHLFEGIDHCGWQKLSILVLGRNTVLNNEDSLSICLAVVRKKLPLIVNIEPVGGNSHVTNIGQACISHLIKDRGLDLSNGGLTMEDFENIDENMRMTIEKLNLSGNFLVGAFPNLQLLKSVTCLWLVGANLQTQDVKTLLCQLPVIQILDLKNNRLTGLCSCMFEGPDRWASLHCLSLANCHLCKDDIINLSEARRGSKAPALAELDLSGNKLTGCLVYLFGLAHHPGWTCLKILRLQNTELSDIDKAYLTKIFRKKMLPHLTKLDPLLTCPYDHWKILLKVACEEQGTEYFDLHNMELSKENMLELGSAVYLKKTLIYLDLSGNVLQGTIRYLFGKDNMGWTKLETLKLTRCQLTRADFGHLYLALQNNKLPKVQFIDILHPYCYEQALTRLLLKSGRFHARMDMLTKDDTYDILCRIDKTKLCKIKELQLSCGSVSEYLGEYLIQLQLSKKICKLERLILNDTNLKEKDVESIADAVKRNSFPCLKVLNLSHNNLRNKVQYLWRSFGTSKSRRSKIESLSVQSTHMSSTDIESLGEALHQKVFPNLTHLDISDNNTTGSLGHIVTGWLPKLSHLELNQTNPNREDALKLAKAIRDGNLQSLEVLSLRNSDLQDWMKQMIDELCHSEWPGLKSLELEGALLLNTDWLSLATAVVQGRFPSLMFEQFDSLYLDNTLSVCVHNLFTEHTLDLSNHRLNADNIPIIATALRREAQHLSLIHTLDLSNNVIDESLQNILCLSHWPNLVNLDLSDTQIGHKTVKALKSAKTSQKFLALQSLNLSSNCLKDNFSYLFVHDDPTGWLNLSDLILAKTSLSSDDLNAIASALAYNVFPKLQNLVLSGNVLSHHLESLLSYIATSSVGSTLRELHISDGKLNEVDVKCISKFSIAGTLHKFDLSKNSVRDCCIHLFGGTVAREWSCLSDLNLAQTEINSDDQRAFVEAVRGDKLPNLQVLNLSGNNTLSGYFNIFFGSRDQPTWATLVQLNVSNTHPNEEDLLGLNGASSGGKLPALKVLDLSQNKLGGKVHSLFGDSELVSWQGLERLCLRNSDLDTDDLICIVLAFGAARDLEYICDGLAYSVTENQKADLVQYMKTQEEMSLYHVVAVQQIAKDVETNKSNDSEQQPLCEEITNLLISELEDVGKLELSRCVVEFRKYCRVHPYGWPNLVSLNMSSMKLTEHDVVLVGNMAACGHLPHLHHLDLSGNCLRGYLKHLFGLKVWPKLTELCLQNTRLDSKDFLCVVQAISQNTLPQLRILDFGVKEMIFPLHPLTNKKVFSEGAIKFCQAVQHGQGKTMQKIDLSGWILTRKLKKVFTIGWPYLQILVLNDTHLDKTDIKALRHAAEQNKLPSIQKLDLSQNNLRGSISDLFGKTKQPIWPQLKQVRLKNCEMDSSDLVALAEADCGSFLPSLKHLDFGNKISSVQQMVKSCFLEIPDMSFLRRLQMTLESSHIFIMAIEVSKRRIPGIRKLHLSDLSLSDHLLTLFSVEWPVLQELRLQNTNLTEADMHVMGEAGAAKRFPALTVLDMSANTLTNQMNILFSRITWPKLRDLHLSHTDLHSADIDCIASAIECARVPVLVFLDIFGASQGITDESCLNLVRTCSRSVTDRSLLVNMWESEHRVQELQSICFGSRVSLSVYWTCPSFQKEMEPRTQNVDSERNLESLTIQSRNYLENLHLFSREWPRLEKLEFWQSMDLKECDIQSFGEAIACQYFPVLQHLHFHMHDMRNKVKHLFFPFPKELCKLENTWPKLQVIRLVGSKLDPEDIDCLSVAIEKRLIPELRCLDIFGANPGVPERCYTQLIRTCIDSVKNRPLEVILWGSSFFLLKLQTMCHGSHVRIGWHY